MGGFSSSRQGEFQEMSKARYLGTGKFIKKGVVRGGKSSLK